MAITNAQQYQQLVNKSANGKRPGYRGPGGYQGGGGSSSGGSKGGQGPAGGASSGGNYGGNTGGGNGGGYNDRERYQNQQKRNAEKAERDRQKREADAAKAAKARADKARAEKEEEDKKAEELSNLGRNKTTKFGTVVGPTAKSTLDRFKEIQGQTASINPDEFLGFKEEDDLSLDDAMKSVFGTKNNITIDPNLTASLDDDTKKGIRSLDPDDIREQYGKDYTVKGKAPKTGDLSSELQTFNTSKAVGDTPIDQEFTGTLNKREQALQDFLDRRNEVKTFGLSSLFQKPLQKVSDFNASINRPFFEDVIRGGKIPGLDFDMTANEFEKAYQSYMSNRLDGKTDAYGNPSSGYSRDASGNIIGSGNDGGDNYVPPIVETAKKEETEEEEVNPRDYSGLGARFMGSQFDFTGLADGGIARAGYMDGGMPEYQGGIMDLETGRQQYFLGKLVKKATRAIKKVVKSPIGKAALMYFGGNALMGKAGGLGGLRGKLFGLGTVPGVPDAISGGGTMGFLGKLGLTKGGGAMMPTLKGGLALGLGIPTAMELLGVGKEEDEPMDLGPGINIADIRANPYKYLAPRFTGSQFAADGGRIGYAEGSKEPVAKETMPLLDMDNQEMDLRQEGGFVPIGRMERADDVPARLSKNEFVFTADAVRNAGEGDIDKGAEVMYNMMKNLESGGEVSEESQGLDGAREMFQTSQRLEEVL